MRNIRRYEHNMHNSHNLICEGAAHGCYGARDQRGIVPELLALMAVPDSGCQHRGTPSTPSRWWSTPRRSSQFGSLLRTLKLPRPNEGKSTSGPPRQMA